MRHTRAFQVRKEAGTHGVDGTESRNSSVTGVCGTESGDRGGENQLHAEGGVDGDLIALISPLCLPPANANQSECVGTDAEKPGAGRG